MKHLLIALSMFLVGCTNLSQFERTNTQMSYIDVRHCNSEGFKSFQDLGNYLSFICNDGRNFLIKHR